MVGRSLDAHNECSAPALMEETPKALRVAVVEDDPRIQQLISAEITDEGCRPRALTPGNHARCLGRKFYWDDNLLDVYIRYLRQKVELDDAPNLINAVRGVGFILREQTN